MDISKIKNIYMIGIKGVGMTMLAQFLADKGYDISGSDINEVFMTDKILNKSGIKVFNGFSEDNIPNNVDLIIYSTAYKKDTNIEVKKAIEGKTKVLTYAEVLGELFNSMYGIAVCGTHGKTTTTAWLGYVLMKSGVNPNVLVGANVEQFEGASISGKSNYLIIEADEYQNKLKYYNPKIALLNNIEHDHHDFYPTFESYLNAFIEFIKKIPKKGKLIANFDDKNIEKIANVNCMGEVISYAIDNNEADLIAYDIKIENGKQYFKVKLNGDEMGIFSISLSGKHNILNALAVIATCIELELELIDIRIYLDEFTGTERRAKVLGVFKGATIIDDYAHHPTEIKTTILGIKEMYGNKNIIVVFHPHTFTRTKALLDELANSFDDIENLVILDIYGSAREEQGGVHSKDLIDKIKEKNPNKKISYTPTLKDAEKYLRQSVGRDDVVVLMGAGDVFRIGESLLK